MVFPLGRTALAAVASQTRYRVERPWPMQLCLARPFQIGKLAGNAAVEKAP